MLTTLYTVPNNSRAIVKSLLVNARLEDAAGSAIGVTVDFSCMLAANI